MNETNSPQVFWATGDRRLEVARFAEEIRITYPGAEKRLQECRYVNEKDYTMILVFGEDWRDFLIRRSGWAEIVEGGLFPGPEGRPIRKS